MNLYSDQNPPTGGNGKRIFYALKKSGYRVADLHYNPNCFGNEGGWGMWAGSVGSDGDLADCFIVLVEKNKTVVLLATEAPYRVKAVLSIGPAR
jgi:hypothetical protein